MSSPRKPIVEVKDISKSYSGRVVLDGVFLELYEAEVFGFLGPNGAGKSTLMKILMGLEKADKGNVLFFGKKFNWETRPKIGIVPQEDFVYKNFSVRENILFFGLLNNIMGDELNKRADFLLEWLGLQKFEKIRAEALSGGYRKLLNIACSIVHDPQIIFLDEPTVALDPVIRQGVWEKIVEMREKKKTVCLTTHYLDEARVLCDRIAIMFQGKIRAKDTPENLIENYAGKEVVVLRLEEKPENIPAELSKEFPSYSVQVSGNEVSIVVPKRSSFEAMGKLSGFFERKKLKVLSSTIKQPGIDEVFFAVTKETKS